MKERIIRISAEICRLFVGIVFVFSGLVKTIDPAGGSIKIEEYLDHFGLDFIQNFSILIAFNLCVFEFCLGVCLLLGAYRRYTTFFINLFMWVMTPLTLYLALFDPVSDCGCFGDAFIISNWETFIKNLFLLAASCVVFKYHKRLFRLYTIKTIWFIPFFAYAYGLTFAWINYNYLPLVDFRPYKVGANIPELMSIPIGAPVDEYDYSFIYEKDCVKKEFSLDDLPTEDTTWVYVDSKTKLLKKGYTPLISSFQLFNKKGEDVSESLLADTTDVYLLIMPDAAKADESNIDRISDLYDYATDHRKKFYAVIGSSDESFQEWTDYTGAEYTYLKADEVMLKTIIRSNPGLISIKNGVILHKWHNNALPKVDELTSKREEAEDFIYYIFSFAVPLLLVLIYDLIRNRRIKRNQN